MFRTTPLPPLFALAFSVCFATTVSAQYLYGDLRDDFAHDHFDGHHDHSHDYGYRLHYDDHHDHGNYYGDGRVANPTRGLSHHHGMPVYTYSGCPNEYSGDVVCCEPNGYPLQNRQTLSGQLTDDYPPRFGLGEGNSGHNHSYGSESHSEYLQDGHSHDGHSHERNSHQGHLYDRSTPARDAAPSDGGYLEPPSLPRGSANNFQPQEYFHGDQPRSSDSIRMDSPPPSSFAPSSLAPFGNDRSIRFTTPPPSTL